MEAEAEAEDVASEAASPDPPEASRHGYSHDTDRNLVIAMMLRTIKARVPTPGMLRPCSVSLIAAEIRALKLRTAPKRQFVCMRTNMHATCM